MILINFLLFLLSVYGTFYIPGFVLLKKLSLKLPINDVPFFSVVSGITLFILLTYGLSWLHIIHVYYLILLFFLAIYLKDKGYREFFHFERIDKTTCMLLVLGTIAFTVITGVSGIMTKNGLQFVGLGAADGIVHIAHIEHMTYSFPPTHPGIAGVPFRGYHYFYDFLLAIYHDLFFFSVTDLYFRFFAALISLLYGGAFVVILSRMTKQKLATYIALLFVYFSQDFSFLLYVINKQAELIHGGGMVQGLQLTSDPSVFLSITLLLAAITLLPKIHKSWQHALLVAVFFGVIAQIKVYTGIAACTVICAYTFYNFIRYKTLNLLNEYMAVFVTVILTTITFGPNNFGAASLIFNPLLFYQQYMQQAQLTPLHWELRRRIFADHHNIKQLVLLYVEAIGLFWIVNLGWKVALFGGIRRVFSKSFWTNEYAFIFSVITVVTLFLGTFFVQSISIFDIIQFYWIPYILFSIPVALLLSQFIQKRRWATVLFLILFIGSFLPGTVESLHATISPTSPMVISQNDLRVYNAVKSVVPERSFFISLPVYSQSPQTYGYDSIPLNAALTNRATYYEGEIIDYNLPIVDKRKAQLAALSSAIASCDDKKIIGITKEIGSSYILSHEHLPCLENQLGFTSVHGDTLSFYHKDE